MSTSSKSQRQIRELINLVQHDLECERYLRVLEQCEHLTEALPQSFLPFTAMTQAFLAVHDQERAMECAKRALRLAPEVKKAQFCAMLVCIQKGDREEAKRIVCQATPCSADLSDKLLELGLRSLSGDSRIPSEFREIRKDLTPSWESIRLSLDILRRCGDSSQLDEFLSSLEIEELGVLERKEVARGYLHLGKPGKALSVVSHRRHQDEGEAICILGKIWAALGNHVKASEYFSLAEGTSGVDATLGLALSLKALGREPEALKLLAEAERTLSELPASDPERNLLLGRVMLATDRMEKGIELFRLSSSQAPYDARPLLELGELFWKTARRGEAINAFLEAYELNPGLCEQNNAPQRIDSHFSRIIHESLEKAPEGAAIPLSALHQRIVRGRISPKWTERLILRLDNGKVLPGKYNPKTLTFEKKGRTVLSQISESRCRVCGEKLGNRAKFCFYCGSRLEACHICKKDLTLEDSEVSKCSFCEHKFHRAHILEWLKLRGTCPVCHRPVQETDLVPDSCSFV